MVVIRRLLLVYLLISSGFLSAQDITFLNYSKSHGIGPQLIDITEDQYGNLWMIGSQGEFYHFDGKNSKTYTFPDQLYTNNVFRIFSDRNEHIWFLTDRGILSFDGKNFDLINLPDDFEPDYRSKICMGSGNRLFFLDSKGNLVVTDPSGLQQLNYKSISNDNKANAIDADDAGTVWLGLENGSFISIGSDLQPSLKDVSGLKGVIIQEMDFYNNTLAVASGEAIYTLIDFKLVKEEQLHVAGVEPIRKLLIDDPDHLWIFRENSLWLFQNGKQILVNEDFGLSKARINRIYKNQNNPLWILTDAKGTYRQNNPTFRVISIGQESIISSLLPIDRARILLGTYGQGIFMGKYNEVKKLTTRSILDESKIISIKESSKNKYLIGTHGNGIFELTALDTSFTRMDIAKPEQPKEIQYIRSMTVDDDAVLIGSHRGLMLWENSTWTNLIHDKKNFVVNCFLKLDSGKLLVGSSQHGLFLLQNGRLKSIDSLRYASTAINSIRKDWNGNYWIGSNRNHIMIYNQELIPIKDLRLPVSYRSIFFVEFPDDQTALIGLLADRDFVTTIKVTKDYQILSQNQYGPEEGWTDKVSFFLGATVKENDGTVWIGTTEGAFQYKATQRRNNHVVPIPYLRKIKLMNSLLDINDYASESKGLFQLPHDLQLPHNLNNLTIGYGANDLANPHSLKYRFRLLGLEPNWSEWTTQDEIIFTNLKPENYLFEVQAMNLSGSVGMPTVYSFSILPALWQKSWFYWAMTLALLSLIFVVYRGFYFIKMRQYKRQEEIKAAEGVRIKQQIAMDFHDELGNKLAGVITYASALQRKTENSELSSALKYMENSAQEIYYKAKDFIWFIDVESNSLLETLVYLRDFGEKFFERNGIRFDLKSAFELSLHNKPLPEGYNRHIILIFKEAMTNALKHSKCTKVDFYSTISVDGMIEIELEDNGIGFSGEEMSGSGLRNMKKRAEAIHGLLQMGFSSGGGGKVSLRFKIS